MVGVILLVLGMTSLMVGGVSLVARGVSLVVGGVSFVVGGVFFLLGVVSFVVSVISLVSVWMYVFQFTSWIMTMAKETEKDVPKAREAVYLMLDLVRQSRRGRKRETWMTICARMGVSWVWLG